MWRWFKSWKLASVLKHRRGSQEAYGAVVELGRLGTPKAVQVLIRALAPPDGVARSAARELGRLGDARAIKPLATLLTEPAVNQAAAEALAKLGPEAVDALVASLRSESGAARALAASALGELGDRRAVEPLVEIMQADNEYAVRTAAARALGELKDRRAIWVMVGTLKLRDETTPQRQAALEELRQAATLALRKIGDPFAARPEPVATAQEAVAQKEQELARSETHPRLLGDLSYLTEAELIGVLRELIAASEEISWANLERREPILPMFFTTYEQRRQAAETVGTELRRRGGRALLRQVLEQELNQHPAISNWWTGLDD